VSERDGKIRSIEQSKPKEGRGKWGDHKGTQRSRLDERGHNRLPKSWVERLNVIHILSCGQKSGVYGHPCHLTSQALSLMLWLTTANSFHPWAFLLGQIRPTTHPSEVIKLLSHPPKCKGTSGSNRVIILGSLLPVISREGEVGVTRYVCTSNFAVVAIVVDREDNTIHEQKKRISKKRVKRQ
jgi:hypothetical protein